MRTYLNLVLPTPITLEGEDPSLYIDDVEVEVLYDVEQTYAGYKGDRVNPPESPEYEVEIHSIRVLDGELIRAGVPEYLEPGMIRAAPPGEDLEERCIRHWVDVGMWE